MFFNQKKLRANNLSVQLGSFSNPILDATYGGTIAIGDSKIFDATAFTLLSNLPLHTEVMALDKFENILYLFDKASQKIVIEKL